MATDIFAITDTYQLMQAVERIKQPASYLVDTFFPNRMPVATSDYIAVEYRKGKRLLAPYITKGSRGVNINRDSSQVKIYAPPMVGPRRVISISDVAMRQFGEQPIFSTMTPGERAAAMQARDLVELLGMIQNRKNKMAADILQTGTTVIKGLADDGVTERIDTVDFGSSMIGTVTADWKIATTSIYDDLMGVSKRIQENTGEIPRLCICGANVEKYLLGNKEILDWLQIPNRQNLAMASFAPTFTAPQARFIGQIPALNMEFVSYLETYTDDDGKVKPFIDPDTVIVCNPGKGKQLYGAIDILDGQTKRFERYAAENVPHYVINEEAQQMSLVVYSRFLLVPDLLDDFVTMKVSNF